MPKPKTKRAGSSADPNSPDKKLPAWKRKLEEILRLIPNYDPWAQRGDAWLDHEAAQFAIDFIQECLTHIEGSLAGKPFLLEPWQKAIVGNLFGWKRIDEKGRVVRRYRELFLFVPRKNGKTPLAAAICLYVLFCDNEPGAQIVSAAGDREQAALLFRYAKGMIENEPELADRAIIFGGKAGQGGLKSIVLKDDLASVYKVISAEGDTKHGGTLHLALIDELHVQPDRNLVDVLTTSMASDNRSQPLTVYITTSDYDRPSICNDKYDLACRVRDNGGDKLKPGYDPAMLPVIYEAKLTDDWKSEKIWAKANPNYGISLSKEYMRRESLAAMESPSELPKFQRLHLNMRTSQNVGWIALDTWDACAGLNEGEKPGQWRKRMTELLKGRDCFVGLDLSSKIDVTAAVLLFRPQSADEPWIILPQFWIPQDTALAKEKRDKVPYLIWADPEHGAFVTLTQGNVIDFQSVRTWLNQQRTVFNIVEIGFDPWAATELARQLMEEDGFKMKETRQGVRTLSDPMKELEALTIARKIRHGNNPVMRWMMGGVAAKQDENGNIQPNKAKSTCRIDGPVAAINGMAAAIAAPPEDSWDGKVA